MTFIWTKEESERRSEMFRRGFGTPRFRNAAGNNAGAVTHGGLRTRGGTRPGGDGSRKWPGPRAGAKRRSGRDEKGNYCSTSPPGPGKNPVSVMDLHATIMTPMGISPKTEFEIEGRPFYATEDGRGKAVAEIFA